MVEIKECIKRWIEEGLGTLKAEGKKVYLILDRDEARKHKEVLDRYVVRKDTRLRGKRAYKIDINFLGEDKLKELVEFELQKVKKYFFDLMERGNKINKEEFFNYIKYIEEKEKISFKTLFSLFYYISLIEKKEKYYKINYEKIGLNYEKFLEEKYSFKKHLKSLLGVFKIWNFGFSLKKS